MDRERPGFQPWDESGRQYFQIYLLSINIYISQQEHPKVTEPVET